jgi:hypothetical protein
LRSWRRNVHQSFLALIFLYITSATMSQAPIGQLSSAVTSKGDNLKLTSPALLSVYDKTGLLPFAKGLKEAGFRLLGSGGTARMIRDEGIEIE